MLLWTVWRSRTSWSSWCAWSPGGSNSCIWVLGSVSSQLVVLTAGFCCSTDVSCCGCSHWRWWRFTADERDKNKMLLAELANIPTVLFFWILFYSEITTHTVQTVLGPLYYKESFSLLTAKLAMLLCLPLFYPFCFESLVSQGSESLLGGVCIISHCLCWFCPGSLSSSHSPKIQI